MTDLLPKAEAKRRFYIYLAVKLGGVAMLAGGVAIYERQGSPWLAALLVAVGAACLFVRPRMLGLTDRR